MHRPLPEEYNHAGNLHGGNLLRHLDAVGSLTAIRYARGRIVTAGVSAASFLGPVAANEIVHFHASVNAVWKSSMEVGIRTEAEHPYTGAARHVGSCYLAFVSLDEQGAPRSLPGLVTENDEDARRMADAARRMAFLRLERAGGSARPGGLSFERMPGLYALCALPPDAPLPNFAALTQGALLGLLRTPGRLCCVLEETALAAFQEKNPALETARGFVCFCGSGNRRAPGDEAICACVTVLASARIAAYSLSLAGVSCLLLHSDDQEQAVERLKQAGHRFA
jgi:acyl-CoA hydrolase